MWQDLRYAVRMLMGRPGFTAVAIVSLALGIGANTAIFSVVNTVLLRPLPYPGAEQLVWFWETQPQLSQAPFSPADFLDYQAQNQSFTQLAAYRPFAFNLTGAGEPEQLRGGIVSANYFSLLGVEPAVGRNFGDADGKAGAARVALLSHGLWRRRFGADPGVIGRALTVSGETATVVGVMPEDYQSDRAELWLNPRQMVPDFFMTFRGDLLAMRRNHFLQVIGRLKPGATLAQAQADVNSIVERLQRQHRSDHGVRLVPLHERVVGDTRPALLVLLGAVALVLLISCANVANLLLARATGRQREIAIRTALGAGRGRVIRQLLTESLLLALLGGGVGWLLGAWGVDLLVAVSPEDMPRLAEIGVDRRVLGFTLLVSVLTGLIFGLVPALPASRPDLNETLKEGGRSATAGKARNQLRGALVAAEVALALVILVGAGLLGKSFMRLLAVNPGFDMENLVTMRVWLADPKYADPGPAVAFFKEIVARLEALPGVQGVAVANDLPVQGTDTTSNPTLDGRPPVPPGQEVLVGLHVVNPGYFAAMGVPLVKGRAFTGRDTRDAPPVIMINETAARRLWPGEEALGKRITFGGPGTPWSEVIGVVGDMRHNGLHAEPGMEAYKPHLQDPWDYMTVALRSTQAPAALAAAVRREVQALDPSQPVFEVKTMGQVVAESVAPRRAALALFGLFALCALLLAAVGIYGVMSYAVTQRRHELGVRVALGAQRRDVLRLVLGQGLRLAGAGVAAGLVAAVAATRLLATQLYGVSPLDPATFVLIALLLILVTLVACYLPARRATKVDPLVALRYE